MDMTGYLYIIENPDIPGWIKVGTTDNLKKRLQQYQTAHPNRSYKIVYSICHTSYKEAETKVKEIMKPFAAEIKNEWYKINLYMAKEKLDEVISKYS